MKPYILLPTTKYWQQREVFCYQGWGYFLDHTVAEPRFLKVVFHNRKVSHVLPYIAPNSNEESNILYEDSRKRISISAVRGKYLVLIEKNKLRLIKKVERGTFKDTMLSQSQKVKKLTRASFLDDLTKRIFFKLIEHDLGNLGKYNSNLW